MANIWGKVRRNKGSMTVEASIVIPMVLGTVMLLIYMGLLVYQHFFLQALANRAAERGAAVWSSPGKDIATGLLHYGGDSRAALYWRIVDPDKNDKIAKVREYILSELQAGVFVPTEEPQIDVSFSDYFVYKKLTVTIERRYWLPIAPILRLFHLSDRYVITARAEASVNEPVELIRNTDFVIDLERQLEERFPGLKSIREKVSEAIQKAMESAKKLIE